MSTPGDHISADDGFVPPLGQFDQEIVIHQVEFRLDGVVELAYSEQAHITEQAAMVKQLTLHPDLIDPGEHEEVLDTLRDWVDRAWEHIRRSR